MTEQYRKAKECLGSAHISWDNGEESSCKVALMEAQIRANLALADQAEGLNTQFEMFREQRAGATMIPKQLDMTDHRLGKLQALSYRSGKLAALLERCVILLHHIASSEYSSMNQVQWDQSLAQKLTSSVRESGVLDE